MSNLGLPEILLILCISFIFTIVFLLFPYWQIFKKAGFPPTLCLLMLIPVVNIVMIYYLAFAEWPALKQEQK
jgi:hypothetical protein